MQREEEHGVCQEMQRTLEHKQGGGGGWPAMGGGGGQ